MVKYIKRQFIRLCNFLSLIWSEIFDGLSEDLTRFGFFIVSPLFFLMLLVVSMFFIVMWLLHAIIVKDDDEPDGF